MLGEFNIQQFVSAFVVLFAVIDVTGSIPIFLSLKKKAKIDAKKPLCFLWECLSVSSTSEKPF